MYIGGKSFRSGIASKLENLPVDFQEPEGYRSVEGVVVICEGQEKNHSYTSNFWARFL
jgi:hypothetical protein